MATWTVASVAWVVDGDTVRLIRSRVLGEVDGLRITATDTAPVPVRLVHIDTPERGEVGWGQARTDLIKWLYPYMFEGRAGLTLDDAGRDHFGRILGDLRAPDGDTATLHMVRDKGWPVWEGK